MHVPHLLAVFLVVDMRSNAWQGAAVHQLWRAWEEMKFGRFQEQFQHAMEGGVLYPIKV